MEVKTLKEAIENLNEAGEFINKAEDKLYVKIDEETSGELETAYLEIGEVLGYLKTLNKEK